MVLLLSNIYFSFFFIEAYRRIFRMLWMSTTTFSIIIHQLCGWCNTISTFSWFQQECTDLWSLSRNVTVQLFWESRSITTKRWKTLLKRRQPPCQSLVTSSSSSSSNKDFPIVVAIVIAVVIAIVIVFFLIVQLLFCSTLHMFAQSLSSDSLLLLLPLLFPLAMTQLFVVSTKKIDKKVYFRKPHWC